MYKKLIYENKRIYPINNNLCNYVAYIKDGKIGHNPQTRHDMT